MTRILCIGDPHFRVDNVIEIEEFVSKLLPLIDERKPDFIVVLGDLLHTHERLHTIPLNKAYDFIDKLREKTKTFVLVGNHDYIQNQQFLTQNHWMNGLKEWENVVIVDKVIKHNNFIFCPYVPPGRFEEALNTIDNWDKATCIFAHQEFFGCKMGAIISVEGDKWNDEFPLVVSGHIHSRQQPQPNIYYTGSAMQHAFGESEQNIIAVFDFDETGNYKFDEVDLLLKRKKIVYLNIDSVDNFAIPKGDDELKLTLKGNYDEFKAFKKGEKYKQLTKDGIKVVFKTDKKESDKRQEEENGDRDNFCEILKNLTYKAGDKEIIRLFELLVNNNEILVL
uniref:Calcineurin-like phosphoesterase domain-containing protein n=1 Tax=viral metagenome TaxID=1070528 RepID=A0A6C0KS08_9ZZZZ